MAVRIIIIKKTEASRSGEFCTHAAAAAAAGIMKEEAASADAAAVVDPRYKELASKIWQP